MNVTLTEARQKAETARKQIEEAQKEMAETVKNAVSEGYGELFARYPFLGSIAWTQYTPYFNDGDPCVFSSSFAYPSVNSTKDVEDGTAANWGDEPGEDFGSKADKERYRGYDSATRSSKYEPNTDYDPEYHSCREAVLEFAKELVGNEPRKDSWVDPTPSTFDGALLRAFGDHTSVTVTRDGIQLGDCEHE